MQIKLSPEARDALAGGRPVVALETSVIAQGLPHPQNLQAAAACEEAVRRAGAVPAAIGILEGEIFAGLTRQQMERLADPDARPRKLASRDLAMAVSTRTSGGTTVSATCEVAAAAGIRVFSTGGIGGVHRGFAEQLDVSQDLRAVAHFPVAVVCAGAKAILDLPKTLEMLETLGVPVIGVRTNEFPSFYSRESGLPVAWRVESASEGARAMRSRLDDLGQGGLVFALPVPRRAELPREEVEQHIASALRAAGARGIRGSLLTPFLLGELGRITGGRTLVTNLALLEHNAAFAGELACADARLRNAS